MRVGSGSASLPARHIGSCPGASRHSIHIFTGWVSGPKAASAVGHVGQPGGCSFAHIAMEAHQEVSETAIDEQRHSRARHNTPDRSRQTARLSDLRDPTAALAVDRERKTRSEYAQWLLRIPTARKIEGAERRVQQAAGLLQYLPHFGGQKSGPVGLQMAQGFRLNTRQRHYRQGRPGAFRALRHDGRADTGISRRRQSNPRGPSPIRT
jgi:hypothetical protein